MGRSLIVMLFLAQTMAEVPVPDGLEWLSRLSANGVLVLVAWWLLTRTIPGMREDHRTELKGLREDHRNQFNLQQQSFEEQMQRLIDVLRDRK